MKAARQHFFLLTDAPILYSYVFESVIPTSAEKPRTIDRGTGALAGGVVYAFF